jgi:hypothetical protein
MWTFFFFFFAVCQEKQATLDWPVKSRQAKGGQHLVCHGLALGAVSDIRASLILNRTSFTVPESISLTQ